MKNSEIILNTLKKCDINEAIKNFAIEHNDELTNEVREKLDMLPINEVEKIKDFLNDLLNLCYDGKIYGYKNEEYYSLLVRLNDKEIHLIKETIIYFLGRLVIKPDIEILKSAYYLENNIYIKFNIVCASLSTFDEEIELDFINKLKPESEYDKIVRSWTMAFYNNIENPYEFIDTQENNWNVAKYPRMKRLAINDKKHKKYLKAMSFRGLDLTVIYLFLENRNEKLSSEDKEIVKNARLDYKKYSDDKKEVLNDLKIKILKR